MVEFSDATKRRIPWLRLGTAGQPGERAEDVAKRAGEYRVRKLALRQPEELGGGPTEHYALYGPSGEDWGGVSKRYEVVQPADVVSAWDQHLDWPVFALGAVRGGRRFFIASLAEPIEVAGWSGARPDTVLHVRIVYADMTGRGSVVCLDEAWRQLCTNGMVAHKWLGTMFSVRHVGHALHSVREAFASIGESVDYRRERLRSGLEVVAHVTLTESRLRAGLGAVYPDPVLEAFTGEGGDGLEAYERARRAMLDSRATVRGLFEGQATGYESPQMHGTGYGFVQAVAEREQYGTPARSEVSLAHDILFGRRQAAVERAWNYVLGLV